MTLNLSVTEHSTDPQDAPTVHYVQDILHRKGLYPYALDGVFGSHTRDGVVAFQKRAGLALRDGIVGPNTYRALVASDPARPAVTSAARFADLAYRLATTGIDGTRPQYVFGAEASMTDPSPDRLDCSELVQWAVTQVDGHTWVDGSSAQYGACRHIGVATAVKTKGALLFISSNGLASGIHHVAVSMGNGWTAEARSAHMTPGVGSWEVAGRGFNLAGLIPCLAY